MSNRRLSILILPVVPPYPPDDGGKICVFGFIDYLRTVNDFTLVIPCYSTAHTEQVLLLQQQWPEVKIVSVELFDKAAEHSPRLSTGRRAINLAKRVAKKLKGATPLRNQAAVQDILSDLHVTTPFYPYPKQYLQQLQAVLVKQQFDIIQVELTRNLNLVNSLPKQSIRVFEQIESRFDVLRDYVETEKIDPFFGNYVIKNTQLLENALIAQYDAVLALNKKDEEYLKGVMPDMPVFTSPFGILNKDLHEPKQSSWIPEKLVFSGNEEHYPNFHALNWYLEEIHEKINSITKLPLYITGKWSQQTKEAFSTKYPKVHFAGYVDDYIRFLQNSIMVVPIKLGGGGIRTKILYAMGNGTPVVATSMGAFGINITHGENIMIADQPDQFADGIKRLVNDASLLQNITHNGYRFIKENYSQTYTAELRNKIYHQLVSGK